MQFRLNGEGLIREGIVSLCWVLLGFLLVSAAICGLIFLVLWKTAAASIPPSQVWDVTFKLVSTALAQRLADIWFLLPLLFSAPFWPALARWRRRGDLLSVDERGITCERERDPGRSWFLAWNEIRLPLWYSKGGTFSRASRIYTGKGVLFIETRDGRVFRLDPVGLWRADGGNGANGYPPYAGRDFPVLGEIKRQLRERRLGTRAIREVAGRRAVSAFLAREKKARMSLFSN